MSLKVIGFNRFTIIRTLTPSPHLCRLRRNPLALVPFYHLHLPNQTDDWMTIVQRTVHSRTRRLCCLQLLHTPQITKQMRPLKRTDATFVSKPETQSTNEITTSASRPQHRRLPVCIFFHRVT